MILGSGDEPAFQIRWWRPGKERFDAGRWIRRRLRSLKARDAGPGAPGPGGFSETAWVRDESGSGRTPLRLWHGYAPAAGLVIEVTVNLDAAKRTRRTVAAEVLPSLVVSETGRAIAWSVFGASFESPAGCRPLDHKLVLGDLALRFRGGDGSCLWLRQVYPAETALARRPVERWMRTWPFKEHRRYKDAGKGGPWSAESFGRTLEGTRQPGRKRLAFPLGSCSPREVLSVAVVDTELDRLLLAEHDAPGRPDESMLAAAIGRMNWALLGEGAGA